MSNISLSLGRQGEKLAAEYLQKKGFAIVHKNFRSGKGELDLICHKDSDLIIVEVKSVRSPHWGYGEERISRNKQRMIIRTTYAFLDRYPKFKGMGVRFDVVIVNFFNYPVQIVHYSGAFWESTR